MTRIFFFLAHNQLTVCHPTYPSYPHLPDANYAILMVKSAFLVAQLVKNPPAVRETWVRSLGWEDPLEKEKATHSSILAWTVQAMGSQRVGHD